MKWPTGAQGAVGEVRRYRRPAPGSDLTCGRLRKRGVVRMAPVRNLSGPTSRWPSRRARLLKARARYPKGRITEPTGHPHRRLHGEAALV